VLTPQRTGESPAGQRSTDRAIPQSATGETPDAAPIAWAAEAAPRSGEEGDRIRRPGIARVLRAAP